MWRHPLCQAPIDKLGYFDRCAEAWEWGWWRDRKLKHRRARSWATDSNRKSICLFFFFFERFNGITFVTSSHRRPARAFPVRCEEENRARKGNIRLPVSVRGLRTSALKLPKYIDTLIKLLPYLTLPHCSLHTTYKENFSWYCVVCSLKMAGLSCSTSLIQNDPKHVVMFPASFKQLCKNR